MIELTDIRKTYKIGPTEVEVLKGISFTISAGELVSLMGSSGSGKSTLMNIIGMLDRPTSGSFRFDGVDILAAGSNQLADLRNAKIGFVFQAFFLLPRLTAVENVYLPLIYRDVGEREMRDRAMHFLERVGMADRADHRPNELSGGQRQRVAIARALVGSPSVVLADEPTGALDTHVSKEIMDLFIELNERDGITVAIITHDPEIAQRCRRRLVVKDGRLVADAGEFDHARDAA